jgi:hypothetical protein
LLSKFGHLITTYKLENVLCKLRISNVTNEAPTNAIRSNASENLWHERLWHISQGQLYSMIHKNITIKLNLPSINSFQFCKSCAARKQHNNHFTRKNNKNKCNF